MTKSKIESSKQISIEKSSSELNPERVWVRVRYADRKWPTTVPARRRGRWEG